MTHAFICEGLRTPIGRYGGALSSVRPDDLLAGVIKAVLERTPKLDPAAIDDVMIGCANQAGEDNRNVARMSALLADLPTTVSGTTLNRLCGSGLDAVMTAARAIHAGEAQLIVAGGVESMSRAPFVMPKAASPFARDCAIYDTTIGWRLVNSTLQNQYGIDSMPETAENVAEEFGISRRDQDAFALRSQERAARAIADGRLALEIAPVIVPRRKGLPVIVNTDEHPRPTSAEELAKLAAPFRAGGTVTAGNSSGVNDGAAAMIIASEAAVDRYGLTPLARVLCAATAGVPPRIMGFGPAIATEKLFARTGHTIRDVDIVELNEAFAAQALAVTRHWGLPDNADHVNPNGGAIALGHPLGMSGTRLALTAATELARRGGRLALCTMCIGVGQGIALMMERV